MTAKKFVLIVALTVLIVLPVAGQSVTDLLQKGIYTQETVGDLDGAIKIYRQVISSASQSRSYAAQAQYRLGLCLLKKGEKAEAAKAFEKLVQDYSDEKELVAKAKEQMAADSKLLPAPWGDTELLHFQIKLPNGRVVGTKIITIEPSETNHQDVIMKDREYMGATPVLWSVIEANRETLRPVTDWFKSPYIGDERTDYQSTTARMEIKGQEPKVFNLDGAIFGNDEWPFWFRRLPLAPGYKTILPIMAPFRGPIKINLRVSGIEDIELPIGKFRCYKVELPEVHQTLWIAVDGARPMVKMEAMGASVELVKTQRMDMGPVIYQDPKFSLSFAAPRGWIVVPDSDDHETTLFLLDPEAKGGVTISAEEQTTGRPEIAKELHASLDEHVRRRSKVHTEYKIRQDSVQSRQIGGTQALSCVAEFLDDKTSMVEYLTWVRSENTDSLFSATVEASGFDEFRKRIDPILENLKIK